MHKHLWRLRAYQSETEYFFTCLCGRMWAIKRAKFWGRK